ncbi:phytanoyl-CoA dioxygenase family protein [Micromonospora rubida]|uniref:Phytanoyl-CoA dioxygenase family protein n=1 Tax=Micromonospora rubida TaxID=2697657 RepID=A0ABW7ST45_9ACTN
MTRTEFGTPLAAAVNCADQVRLWISSDGLPSKHRARLIRLRVMNPGCRILLIVARSALIADAGRALDAFAARLDIEIQDIGLIEPVDADERLILEHVRAEIDAFFAAERDATGNLSVVSDYLRLLDFVLRRGLCADMDVEFPEPLPASASAVPCPLGVIARFKHNGCVSNDVTAGIAQSPPLRLARRNVAALIRTYREAACRYLVEQGIDRAAELATISSHPRFFELRNRQHDETLTGTARFSLTGGPDSFAISLHQAGIHCGFETDVLRGVEAGELIPDHVPHVLTGSGAGHDNLRYEPYRFGPTTSAGQATFQRDQLWPAVLPDVVSHWDHSWIADHDSWRALTYREHLLLTFFDSPGWSPREAAELIGPRQVMACPNRPAWSWSTGLLLPPVPDRRPVPARSGGRAGVGTPDAPSDTYRRDLRQRLDDAGSLHFSQRFVDNGIVAVQGLIGAESLAHLRAAFAVEVGRKTSDGALQQGSFNLSVDPSEAATRELFREVAASPPLIDIVEYYLGGPSKFVSARGYRQGPCRPLRYRAWDYHQDMKTSGPFEEVKVMLLLTDVPPGGQAMRYACGTQAYLWDCETQQQTKFTLDEALTLGGQGMFVAYGPAGTAVLFDTNGIHAGHRNLSVTRDVITLNFTRAGPGSFYIFSDPVLTRQTQRSAARPTATRLTGRFSVADGPELARIREAYHSAPVLEDVRQRWDSDALQLVDIAIADLNVDLDLRLSRPFADDRARDIGLVAIRDAALHDVQYADLLRHLGTVDHAIGPPLGESRCLWQQDSPLAAVGEIAEEAHHRLSARASGAAAENCAALLRDLAEAIGRCDRVERLRTTTIFVYFAVAWAFRLLHATEVGGFDARCRELLHFYVHLVAWDDVPSPGKD